MAGNIGIFMANSINRFMEIRNADDSLNYQYRKEGRVNVFEFKTALKAETQKFFKAAAGGKKQISEKDFLDFLKKNLKPGNYIEGELKKVYDVINYNKNSSSKGIDEKELTAFIVGLDAFDNNTTGILHHVDILSLIALIEKGQSQDLKNFFSYMNDTISSLKEDE